MSRARAHPAFSLIELVLVVVILGIIGAIALPRMSRASEGAGEAALAQNLATLTRAVEVYKAEHNGAPPTTRQQLLLYSDEDGDTSATGGAPYLFGPYLRTMPALPIGSNKGKSDLVSGGSPGTDSGGGWWIDSVTGDVRANAPDTDLTAKGVKLNTVTATTLLKKN